MLVGVAEVKTAVNGADDEHNVDEVHCVDEERDDLLRLESLRKDRQKDIRVEGAHGNVEGEEEQGN